MSAVAFEAQAAVVCPLYPWFAKPCYWYAGHVYSIRNPNWDPETVYTSNVALRILKAIGCLLISPFFLIWGIGFIVSRHLAEEKIPTNLPLAPPLTPIPTLTLPRPPAAPVSQPPSPEKEQILQRYSLLWKQRDARALTEDLRKDLKGLLAAYQPQEHLKTDLELKCVLGAIQAFEESERWAQEQKVRPSLGSVWMPLRQLPPPQDAFVQGLDVLPAKPDGNCLYQSFLNLLELESTKDTSSVPPNILQRSQEILQIREPAARIGALRTLVADTITQVLQHDFQGEWAAFSEIQTWGFVESTITDSFRTTTAHIQQRLASIEQLLQTGSLSEEDQLRALREAEKERQALTSLQPLTNEAYIAKIRSSGFHGGCLELSTLSTLFHVRIEAKKVLRFDATQWRFEGNDPTYLSFGSQHPEWPLFTLIHTVEQVGEHFDAALNIEEGSMPAPHRARTPPPSSTDAFFECPDPQEGGK